MVDPSKLTLEPSAHLDTFCRDSLPPPKLWPRMIFSGVPELAYPPRLNCVAELLDARIDAGDGERTAILFPSGRWSYRELYTAVNRIAHVLVEDLGLIPGNRVLLRGPNTPLLAACWLAVATWLALAATSSTPAAIRVAVALVVWIWRAWSVAPRAIPSITRLSWATAWFVS